MLRRQFTRHTTTLAALGLVAGWPTARALSLGDLAERDAAAGLRAALEKGALTAVGVLGRNDGFLGNEKVRIPLPDHLQDAAKLLRRLGQRRRVDELEVAMNRAAETAVPAAKDLLVGAVRSMTVADAKNILTGGDTAATQFFAAKTREPLAVRFLPIVTEATQRVGLARRYNELVAKASSLGLLQRARASIEGYVTGKALDGLFFMIGEEEKAIRKDPLAAGSAIIAKVFSGLGGLK